jgi:CHASE2 domain-containing sensor protein
MKRTLWKAVVGSITGWIGRRPLIRAVIRAMPVILAVVLATVLMSSLGWLERFESAGFDTFNILQSPRDPSHVVLAAITDEDYRNLFAETSPLDPARLYQIIQAIAQGSPSLIAVDIDTSSSVFRRFQAPPDWPPIVWGQDFEQSEDFVRPLSVLAGQPIRDRDSVGIAALPQDSDGIVRRHLREFRTEKGTVPSFPWQVIQTASNLGISEFRAASLEGEGHNTKGLLLNFSGERYNLAPLSVGFVLQGAQGEDWKLRGPFKNKVVILGGSYRAARDTYVTPVGMMLGVQLMAQAVESEMGGGIRGFNHFVELLFDLVCGVLLVVVHHRFRPSLALALSLIAIPVFCLCGSYLAFSTMARWFNFVPVVVGVQIHQLYDHAKDYSRMQAQLAAIQGDGRKHQEPA